MNQKNISAGDIEKTTGLNKNTIYSILTGHSKNPGVHNLQLIAKALNVTLESLLIDDQTIDLQVMTTDQVKAFSDATQATSKVIIEKNLTLSLEKYISLIKEIYQYSIKVTPADIDDRFIHWIIDKYYKS